MFACLSRITFPEHLEQRPASSMLDTTCCSSSRDYFLVFEFDIWLHLQTKQLFIFYQLSWEPRAEASWTQHVSFFNYFRVSNFCNQSYLFVLDCWSGITFPEHLAYHLTWTAWAEACWTQPAAVFLIYKQNKCSTYLPAGHHLLLLLFPRQIISWSLTLTFCSSRLFISYHLSWSRHSWHSS